MMNRSICSKYCKGPMWNQCSSDNLVTRPLCLDSGYCRKALRALSSTGTSALRYAVLESLRGFYPIHKRCNGNYQFSVCERLSIFIIPLLHMRFIEYWLPLLLMQKYCLVWNTKRCGHCMFVYLSTVLLNCIWGFFFFFATHDHIVLYLLTIKICPTVMVLVRRLRLMVRRCRGFLFRVVGWWFNGVLETCLGSLVVKGVYW